MQNFFQNIVLSIGITDVIDILIVAFVVYKVLGFIRETRAEQLIKGLLILVAATFLADAFDLYTISWILNGTLTLGVIALVIVFQPELRRGLEYVGRSKIVKSPFGQFDKEKAKLIVSSFTKAIDEFFQEQDRRTDCRGEGDGPQRCCRNRYHIKCPCQHRAAWKYIL